MTKKSRKRDVFELEGGETWLNRTWRPAAAVVYLLICLFDFIIAPAFMGFKSASIAQMAVAVKDLEPTVASALIAARTPWEPLTLQGSGLFHVAFGAILGVAAWTRGAAQIEQVKQQGAVDSTPTPPPAPAYYQPAYPQPYPQPYQPYMPAQVAPQPDMGTGVDNPDAEPDKY
jgi:hypothetical protein